MSQPACSRTGYRRSFLATLIWLPVNVVVAIAINQDLPSSEQAGAFVGTALLPLFIGSLIVLGIARAAKSPAWPFWQLVLMSLPAYLIPALMLNIARMASGS